MKKTNTDQWNRSIASRERLQMWSFASWHIAVTRRTETVPKLSSNQRRSGYNNGAR
jgi:hypothetical protein